MAAQIEAALPSRRLYAGQGASGAIMALVAVFAMSYPDAQIGVILLPGSVDAQLALGLIAAFETYGLVFGIPFLRWGHSVHLAGLAIGTAYVHFDRNGRIWNSARRFAFNQMRRIGMI
jgi:rhomboid-like protein